MPGQKRRFRARTTPCSCVHSRHTHDASAEGVWLGWGEAARNCSTHMLRAASCSCRGVDIGGARGQGRRTAAPAAPVATHARPLRRARPEAPGLESLPAWLSWLARSMLQEAAWHNRCCRGVSACTLGDICRCDVKGGGVERACHRSVHILRREPQPERCTRSHTDASWKGRKGIYILVLLNCVRL